MDTDSSHLSVYSSLIIIVLIFLYTSFLRHWSANNTNLSLAFKKGLPLCTLVNIATIFAFGLICSVILIVINDFSTAITGLLFIASLVFLMVLDRLAFLMSKIPLNRTFSVLSGKLVGSTSVANSFDSAHVSDEESLQELEERVIAAADDETVDDRDREMLKSILRLDFSTVREIMVPSPDIISVDVNKSVKDTALLMSQHGHSKIPVFENTQDSIVGIAHAKDILSVLAEGRTEATLKNVIRTAMFVPETKKLHELLEELQQNAVQMAIVIDEYGGTEGIVTMEDMLEEIVGEIEDEFSVSDNPVVHLPDGSVIVDAGILTDDLEDMLGVNIDGGADVDTLGGYVYRELGRMPYVGDQVHAGDLRIEIVSILGHRLRKLKIDRITSEETNQESS